jgi:phenylacetate-CoA ligase
MGRTDDMLIIRGVNVFPSQIETVLLKSGMTPNYQIIVDRVRHADTLEVLVEMTPDMFSDTVKDISGMESQLVSEMRSILGISPKVTLAAGLAFASLSVYSGGRRTPRYASPHPSTPPLGGSYVP